VAQVNKYLKRGDRKQMKKIIAAAAIAGLGTAFAVSAQAQSVTIGSNPPGTYSINVAETTTNPASVGGDYMYNYLFTLSPSSAAGVDVNTLSFGFPTSQINGVPIYDPSTPTDPDNNFIEASNSADAFSFAANPFAAGGGGLNSATPTTDIYFGSLLPPTGTVNVTPDASGTVNGAGLGGYPTGPGTAVPEVSSFALIGLGLLPLGLIARRRIMK
jgi:hypothetical protein